MGNEFSNDTNNVQSKKPVPKNTKVECKYCAEEDVDYLKDFYGRSGPCKHMPSNSHYDKNYSNSDNHVFVNNRGMVLPYLPASNSIYHNKHIMSESDKITEVEIAICKDNSLNETIERHKINHNAPTNMCKDKNCYCVKKTIIASNNPNRDNRKRDLFDSISDNVQEIHKLVEIQSRRPMRSMQPMQPNQPVFNNSATSSDNSITSPYNPISIPKNLTTSIDNFATSSDMPVANNNQANPPRVTIKMAGGAKKKYNSSTSSISLSLSSDSNNFSDSSDSDDYYKQSRTKSKSVKKHKSHIDTNSSDDGIIFSDDSITTSDLYKIQGKIFDQESNSESGENSTEYGDKVDRAIDRMEMHKGIFSPESKDILGISDSDKYNKKKVNKNKKYATKK